MKLQCTKLPELPRLGFMFENSLEMDFGENFFQDTFIINSFLLLLPKLTLYGDYFMIHTHAAINLPENCIVVNGLKDS